MSSSHWDPNSDIVPFVLENMDSVNDSSVVERLKSRRASRSDRRCIRETISRTFGLPLSGLRIPSAAERLKDASPEDIVVYEALFSYGFRGIVPSLVAEVSRYLGISSGQIYPMVSRMLMALEVMGDLNSIEVSVASVLYAFYFKPYAGDINRYNLQPRRNLALVTNSEIGDQCVSEKSWRHIGHLNKGEEAARKRIIEQLLELLSEQRSLEFLSSRLSLERSAIWDCNMSTSQRASAPDPFELFLAASGKLAEMGSSAPASESQVRTTEISRGGTLAADKRKAEHSPGGRMESQREKVMFSFRSVEAKLAETVEDSSKDHEDFFLMREKYEAVKKGMDQLAAKDKEIGDLRASIAGHEQAKEELHQKVAELTKEVELKDEEVRSLKRKNELLQAEYDFFLGGSEVITRWETMKKYLTGRHLTWDLEGLDRRYTHVVKAQAQFKGMPAPEVVEPLVAPNNGSLS
ncbi:unnamed protein product [Cochlearia groenlandica]